MRARWEGLHAALLGTVRTLRTDTQFKQLATIHGELKRFQSADAVIAFLNSSVDQTDEGRRQLDEKDRIYRALVETVQSHSNWRDLAISILWLGLWPGLDVIYRRRLRNFDGRFDELVAEISFILTTTVERIDLSGVSRLASTLIMNVERDIREGLKRGWADREQTGDHPCLGDDDPHLQVRPTIDERALPVDAGDIRAVRGWLIGIIGEDADLVIGATLLEFDLHELANKLSIAHDAARKRFQRAVKQIRDHEREWSCGLSQSASESRVSGAKAASRPKGED